MTNLVELLEAEGLRDKLVVVGGGPRILLEEVSKIKLSKAVLLILTLLMIFYLINITVSFKQSLIEQKEYEKIKNYIEVNGNSINRTGEDYLDFTLLDKDLTNKEILFTGEIHGVEANSKLRLNFLKYFKEKTDFIYYLCEMPYSGAYFINKYLDTGDETILKEYYQELKGTYEWNVDNYNHWKELYDYNKALSKEERLQVIGVDIEHVIPVAIDYLINIIPENPIPYEISEMINEIKINLARDKNSLTEDEVIIFIEKLLNDIYEKEDIYKSFYNEDFIGLKLVAQNIIYKNEVYSDLLTDEEFNAIRDKYIYQNFKQLYNYLPSNKYYGQWGLNHIYQSEYKNIKWFATYLNDDFLFKDKIISIAFTYLDSSHMSIEPNNTYSTRIMSFDKQPKYFNRHLQGDLTLFKLNSENSPFLEELIWPIKGEIPESGVTTDYFQYLVVISKSYGTEPLDKL